ncbi:unknown [Ruminococcus sp. CAG:379]|nr:unknown [Ruminococcus sp. CAG:379]
MTFPSGIRSTSSSQIMIFGCERIFSVTIRENACRSTARAPPASTAVAFAQGTSREPSRSISAFNMPGAESSRDAFRELEHTSSAKVSAWWAGVCFFGFISYKATDRPAWAICQAASQPASPAPMTRIIPSGSAQSRSRAFRIPAYRNAHPS